MKKLALLCGLLASTASFAAEEPKAQNPINDNLPRLALRVFDMSGKVARPVGDSVISLNANHRLCWVAFNLPILEKNKVVEVFNTPEKSTYKGASGSTVQSSEDGKTHIISSTVIRNKDNVIQQCWSFDKSDPKGKYSLTIQVNDISYPAQTFEIKE